MTTDRFQLVGSLLRPANLLAYKNQIEVRDDIQYPFYDAFEGYQETETSEIKKIVARQLEASIPVITDGEYSPQCGIWILSGVLRVSNALSPTMAIPSKILMVVFTKHAKILAFALPSHSPGKITISLLYLNN